MVSEKYRTEAERANKKVIPSHSPENHSIDLKDEKKTMPHFNPLPAQGDNGSHY